MEYVLIVSVVDALQVHCVTVYWAFGTGHGVVMLCSWEGNCGPEEEIKAACRRVTCRLTAWTQWSAAVPTLTSTMRQPLPVNCVYVQGSTMRRSMTSCSSSVNSLMLCRCSTNQRYLECTTTPTLHLRLLFVSRYSGIGTHFFTTQTVDYFK